MSSIWHSLHASVHVLLEEFHIFFVKVGIHAQVRTGNVDIIPTSSVGGVYGGLAVDGFNHEMWHFSRSSRSSGVERHFSEPSMAKSFLPSRAPLPMMQRCANTHLSTSLSLCQKQQQHSVAIWLKSQTGCALLWCW